MSCGDNQHSVWFHISVGSCITIACLLGNAPLLWIYARNKQPLKKKLFEVSFAVVDIVACTLQIHTIPFIEGSITNLIYDVRCASHQRSTTKFIGLLHGNVHVLVSWSID